MTEVFLNSFILFFITIDTIGNLPFFISLTEGANIKKKNQIALKSVIIAFFITILFAYVGKYLLDAIGVTLDSLKIAGGFILMFIAIDILFEKRKIRREKKVEAALDEKNFDEIIVFPMAIPFIAGPSTLATIILLLGNYSTNIEFQLSVILALVAALIVSLFLMIGASFTTKYIPQQILHATSRVFAFILAALATQFIIDGIKASFNI
ncbi:MAG: MarC family protein [Candidatus Pelagibacterales bacterium]|nr:MAG: MarC family protein [Pelagibacterales bacterium]